MKRTVLALLLFSIAACSGGGKGTGGGGTGSGTSTDIPDPCADQDGNDGNDGMPDPCADRVAPDADPVMIRPPDPVKMDRIPEVFAPAWKAAGVGQQVSFGVAAIDQDLDETRVEIVKMPKTAKFDAITQTVTWKPTKKDMPSGSFTIKVSNLDASGAETGAWEHTWEIAVVKKKQPVPVADRQSAVIETLMTIREAARLEKVNKDWSFDKFLLRSAELQRATMPPEAQKKLGKLDKKKLFTSFLASMAVTHGNARIDPSSPSFQKKVFGDPKAWKIVAVRPRVDKKWQELRIVFQAVNAPEPVFAMFRIRPTWDVPTLPADARAYNNKVMSELVWKHLLDADGKPSDTNLKKPKVHGKAVAALVTELLAYDDSATNPWARAAFLALPTEARLGGGSVRNEDGSYRSGDGWAWSVTKPMPTADGGNLAYVAIGIPGFFTDVVPSPDGATWAGKCGPRWNPDDKSHVAGWEVLCRKDKGFVDLPDLVDGKVASGKKDANNLFTAHKTKDMVERLPLEDGRREVGEENGMTCSQCHIRNFGMRDHGDLATVDPRQGAPRAMNHEIPTLNFQIIPTTTWEAFTLEFMQDQECKAAKLMEAALGKPTGLGCPLASP